MSVPSGETLIFSLSDLVINIIASDEENTEAEIKFKFRVPKLPDAVSETKFRIIGTEEKVEGSNGCERLVNPSFPDGISSTSDKDMICFKYNSIFTK